MNEEPLDPVVPIEMFERWEVPAELAPGVLYGEQASEGLLSVDVALPDFVAWVARAAVSGESGHPASDAIQAKVQGVLKELRQNQGADARQDLKERVKQVVRKHAPNGKLPVSLLEERLDAFFAAVPEEQE